jgi:hypothetical protein
LRPFSCLNPKPKGCKDIASLLEAIGLHSILTQWWVDMDVKLMWRLGGALVAMRTVGSTFDSSQVGGLIAARPQHLHFTNMV